MIAQSQRRALASGRPLVGTAWYGAYGELCLHARIVPCADLTTEGGHVALLVGAHAVDADFSQVGRRAFHLEAPRTWPETFLRAFAEVFDWPIAGGMWHWKALEPGLRFPVPVFPEERPTPISKALAAALQLGLPFDLEAR